MLIVYTQKHHSNVRVESEKEKLCQKVATADAAIFILVLLCSEFYTSKKIARETLKVVKAETNAI
jgi:hypothetical protein